MNLTDKSQLIKYLKENNLYTKHSLGQNFLVDQEVLEKIIAAAELKNDDLVFEVGPGVGTLTTELVKRAGKVIAMEKDDRLAELLKMNHESGIMNNDGKNHDSLFNIHDSGLQIINSDILKINLPEIVADKPYKVVANIPYYITSKILEFFLTQENRPESIVLLVQKEVAERICAKPGNLSVLAISVQLYGEPEIVSVVKKESFFPTPEVDSAILKIRIHNSEFKIKPENEKSFFRLIHIGFASKRKTLVNNLAAGFHLDKKQVSDIIKRVGFKENVRAQELSIEEWMNLQKVIQNSEFRIQD